ncbi:activating transcription factor 7-interacting protein 1 isoform X2 [Maniola jurtina]|uniref:activating transcription factor 7-interacting protein 1 isoform X2 n=1 Tax=Maniola jurtina TaxID=191418 RepID=UPI001E68A10B|nr:activating transcription factor 7-interacting protein 1 isoform X2 [Maniola jurtina]
MQLMADTDTEISVQTKMSTIQQESLSEKFINTSLIQSARIDNITDECVKNQEIEVDANVDAVDQAIQSIATNQIPILNQKSNDNFEDLKIRDKQSTENNENDKKDFQETVNSQITIKLHIPVEEKIEIGFCNVEHKNNSEIKNKNKLENKQNCELDKDVLSNRLLENKIENEEQVKANTEKDNVETQHDVNISMRKIKIDNLVNSDIEDTVEDQFVVTNEMENKTEKQNQENIEVDITIDEQDKMNNIVKVDTIDEQVEVTDVEAEDRIENQSGVEVTNETEYNNKKQNQENIEMDITNEEQDKVNIHIIADKIEMTHKMEDKSANQKEIEVNNKTKEKIVNKESVEVDVTIKEQDKINITITADDKVEQLNEVTHKIENKIEKPSQENINIDVTMEEQDKININITADKIKELVEETHECREKIGNETAENMELDIIIEEQGKDDNGVSSTADKCVGKIDMTHEIKDKTEIQSEENIEMDVAIDEKNKVTSSVTEDKIKEDVKLNNAIEDQVKVTSEIENEIEPGNRENSEMDVTFEVQDNVNTNVTEKKIEELHSEKGSMLEKVKYELEAPEYSNNSAKENKTEAQSNDHNEKVMFDKLCEDKSSIQDKFEEQQNEISAIINKLEQEEEGRQVKDNVIEQIQINSDIEDRQNAQISIPKDIIANLDEGSADNCKINQLKNNPQAPPVNSEKTIDKNRLDDITNITHDVAQKNSQSEEISQAIGKHKNESERMSENVHNTTKIDAKNMIENTEQVLEIQDSNEERRSNTIKNNTESAITQMDTDEVIDIADEKDEDDEKEPINIEKIDTSVRKAESELKNDIQENKSISNDEVAAETDEKKKKLKHISKLSNTLDILSDEEENLPKEELQKKKSSDKECTSINIDDDDDIMLIDEESSPKDEKNKTESKPEPENEVLKQESVVELKDKEQLSPISDSRKDTIQAEVAAPSIAETKTSEPKVDLITPEETPASKKPLVKMNFLNTYKKDLADMTRDELEQFCILKIVESVVDRSNLSEMKSQFKAMAQNIEEYKKKASALTKQNRDLQVVLKSVQEEQKKKSNMPITPLKITRSVGMQVLMTDKVGVRKKAQNPNTAKNNAATNSGPNRQGKPAQNNIRLQKMLTNTTHNSPIPVPRLVPAVNNSNMKIQPSPANTPGKPQVTGPVVNKSPVTNVSNGLPATPLPKPEKRPHSRMQNNDSLTVDLTDDEPPAKVISRNAAPPVRLVPPQNLLAPNRQPFGQNVSSPRKVYIPISGSQTPVGVRPGQTIMLRTISPQGPRQRVPTPGIAKPNQNPGAVRMQRVPSRHPAPLPESVKQYQPQNWKALPPAPELKLSKVENGIVISWKIDGYQEDTYEEIASYQLYAYQETTSPPSTALWKKIGDVKALALPMACTLTQFMAGYKYYFAVRAVDIRSRLGPFSLPGSILLLNKM